MHACVCVLVCITLVDVLHDCCHLPPLGHPGLGSPCWTATQKKRQRVLGTKHMTWITILYVFKFSHRLRLTSVLRPMKGMLVSHIATRWASSLLKAHISPERLGFFGSGSPWSPEIYRTEFDLTSCTHLLHLSNGLFYIHKRNFDSVSLYLCSPHIWLTGQHQWQAT